MHQIGAAFGYIYGFGDSGHHVIEIEDVADPGTNARRAMCVAGERACHRSSSFQTRRRAAIV